MRSDVEVIFIVAFSTLIEMPLRTRTNSFLGKHKKERNKLPEMEQKSSQTIEMQLIGQDFAQTTFPTQLQLIYFHFLQ